MQTEYAVVFYPGNPILAEGRVEVVLADALPRDAPDFFSRLDRRADTQSSVAYRGSREEVDEYVSGLGSRPGDALLLRWAAVHDVDVVL